MARLNRESLEFAREHITNYYDSDFFPKPFEYKALWANWDDVTSFLTSKDISEYIIEQPRTFASIKPNGTFRVVHQLDPISTLLYTSLAYIISGSIESARFPVDEYVACSYRIQINKKKGAFFADGSGYKGFIKKSRALSKKWPYVLVTDITDYYNQIYIHRLQNIIEIADASMHAYSRDIEKLLLHLNGSVSQGVPVGPAASIIMGEAVLIDVDNYIKKSGFEHTRYVDDFRIFGTSTEELRQFLATLTEYMYHNHRLTLAGEKTAILRTERFLAEYLDSPQETEKVKIHDTLAGIQSFQAAYGTIDSEVDEKDIRPSVLAQLMKTIVSSDVLNLGLARHVLRKSRKYRIRSILPDLLDNFTYFLPVISDVILYMMEVTNQKFVQQNVERILDIISTNAITAYPYYREWMEYYIVNNKALLKQEDVIKYIYKHASIRGQAIATVKLEEAHKAVDWVRSHKVMLPNLSSWDRRAVILSSRILSKKEMDSWLASVEKSTDNFMELMTIKWVKSTR